MLNSGHSSEYIHFHLLDALFHGQAFFDIHIRKPAFVRTDNSVTLTLEQQFHGQIAHFGCIYPIPSGGGTASLNVAKNCHTRIQINGIFDFTSVVYYLSLCGVFLFLAVQALEKRRWNE